MASILKRTYKSKTRDGRTVVKTCRSWTIEYTGPDGRRRRRGYVDKGATLQLAAKLERAAARGEQDLLDPYREHRRRPLAGHVADYVADLRTAGRSPKYVGNVGYRLNVLLDACGWATLDAVDAGSSMRWRETAKAKARKKGRALDSPVAGGVEFRGATLNTVNRAFCVGLAVYRVPPGSDPAISNGCHSVIRTGLFSALVPHSSGSIQSYSSMYWFSRTGRTAIFM